MNDTTFCPQCEEPYRMALAHCPHCDAPNGNADLNAAAEAMLKSARQAPIEPGGMSFPNYCAMCGGKWSINHKCKGRAA
jgi:hypothetical protein